MKTGFKKQIKKIDSLIKGFQEISLNFSRCNEYKQTILKLQQDRAELTSKIGVKKLQN